MNIRQAAHTATPRQDRPTGPADRHPGAHRGAQQCRSQRHVDHPRRGVGDQERDPWHLAVTLARISEHVRWRITPQPPTAAPPRTAPRPPRRPRARPPGRPARSRPVRTALLLVPTSSVRADMPQPQEPHPARPELQVVSPRQTGDGGTCARTPRAAPAARAKSSAGLQLGGLRRRSQRGFAFVALTF